MAFFWPRGPHFDPKPQKHSVPSCYNPKQSIPGPKLVSERLCHFWVLQAPQNLPRPPQTPPMVQGGQKWPKCTCTSPVLIINDNKTNFGRMNILTYFFTRNVPVASLAPSTQQRKIQHRNMQQRKTQQRKVRQRKMQ